MIKLLIDDFKNFVFHLYQSKSLLMALAVNDFREKYRGSYLGLLWAILRPLIFVLTIWFIFSIGFKRTGSEEREPFILYLLCGFIPWFFFSEALNGSMNSIVNNAFLVKKVNFQVNILPLVKIISAFFLHLVFLLILIIVLFVHGFYPKWYWLQLPYYFICMTFLILGLGWLSSSLRVFTKDVEQVVGVILQLGFWVTPIFWQLKMVPEKYLFLVQLNPMIYIVEGYRDIFLKQTWFWEKPESMAYFLLVSTFFLLIGVLVFKRLRPHFGDVL